MKVIVPYAQPRDRARGWALDAVNLALRQDGWEPQYEAMVCDESYFGLISGLWQQRETFCIIEHDIIVWPGALTQIQDCPELWCTFPYYSSMGWIRDGLGVAKFGSGLMQQYPDFFMEPFPRCCSHTRHYCGLDRFIAHRAMELGLRAHVHEPGVVNLNDRWT